jgi:hypothetical protein
MDSDTKEALQFGGPFAGGGVLLGAVGMWLMSRWRRRRQKKSLLPWLRPRRRVLVFKGKR